MAKVTRRLRVLWLTWKDLKHPEAGGAEVLTNEVTKRLAAAGHDVTVFTSAYEGCKSEESVEGVRVIRAGTYKNSVFGFAKKYYDESASKKQYDVIVDGINTRPFQAPSMAKHGELVIALVSQLAREYWFYETPFPVNYVGYHVLEKRWLRRYVRIPTITVSESTRRDLVELGFANVEAIHLGVNFEPLAEVGEKEAHPVIVYSGRFNRAKRPDVLLEAFHRVRRDFPDAELWFIGKGYLRNRLEKNAPEGVKFFDGISNIERRSLTKRAWVLVNPSIREGFGLNILEANALGVPCVAFDVPGLRDSIVDGETGLLVRGEGTEALAKVILRVLGGSTLRSRLSWGALSYSRRFSWDRTAEEFMKIMNSFELKESLPSLDNNRLKPKA